MDGDTVSFDNFHSDKIAVASVEAFPLRQRLNDPREPLRQLVSFKIKQTRLAGVGIGQFPVVRAGW